jgi:hypothetical protein
MIRSRDVSTATVVQKSAVTGGGVTNKNSISGNLIGREFKQSFCQQKLSVSFL